MKHIISLFGLLLLLSACEHEVLISKETGKENVPDDKVLVEIFARANPYGPPATKAVEDEEKVGMTPWVLVFKGNDENATFVEAVQATETATKRFVILTRQPIDNKYQLLILANPQSRFFYGDAITGYAFSEANFIATLTPGTTTLAEASQKLMSEPLSTPSFTGVPYGAVGTTIPMSYLLEVDKIDDDIKIENNDGTSLELIRTVAKIVIINKADNMTFKGIAAAVNVPRQGQLHNFDNSILNNLSNLTEYRQDATYSSLLATAETVAGGQSTEKTPIYLYESDTQNNTYIIIKGTYGGKDYYYKMAIVDNSLQPMNLLRNQKYTFTIINAKGPGYDTVADAKASKASNVDLDFRILVDNINAYEIMANNDYYLGVSNSVYIRYTSVRDTSEAFKLVTNNKTNFPNSKTITANRSEVDYQLGVVSPTTIPTVGGGSADPLITPVNIYVLATLMWYEGWMSNKNDAYVILKLGNLEKKIHIRQRPAIPSNGVRLMYMPTANNSTTENGVRYYCLSASVEDGADNPKDWIKLRPSTGADRNDTDNITVDNGIIYIDILPNTSTTERRGVVYLTTIRNTASSATNRTQRIKIDITQLGSSISVN